MKINSCSLLTSSTIPFYCGNILNILYECSRSIFPKKWLKLPMSSKNNILTIEGDFDYSDFLKQKVITDCVLICPNDNNKKYNAHRIILANSADFFLNSFTCGMAEEASREVEITTNPGNVFPLVLNWIYSGKIQVEKKNLLNIIEVACFYSVTELCKSLDEYLTKYINKDNILELFDQCYQENLNNAKNFLAKHLVNFLDEIDMSQLTNIIEVPIFCKALSKYAGSTEQKIDLTNQFLNDYTLSPEEFTMIQQSFTPKEQTQGEVMSALNKWRK